MGEGFSEADIPALLSDEEMKIKLYEDGYNPNTLSRQYTKGIPSLSDCPNTTRVSFVLMDCTPNKQTPPASHDVHIYGSEYVLIGIAYRIEDGTHYICQIYHSGIWRKYDGMVPGGVGNTVPLIQATT